MASKELIRQLLKNLELKRYTNPTEAEAERWFQDLPDEFIVRVIDEDHPENIYELQDALYQRFRDRTGDRNAEIAAHILGFYSAEDRARQIEAFKWLQRINQAQIDAYQKRK